MFWFDGSVMHMTEAHLKWLWIISFYWHVTASYIIWELSFTETLNVSGKNVFKFETNIENTIKIPYLINSYYEIMFIIEFCCWYKFAYKIVLESFIKLILYSMLYVINFNV